MRLRAAYRDPWLAKRELIFNYYNYKLKADPRSRQSKYTDLNVHDDPEFTHLRNLKVQCVDRARRAQANFLSEELIKGLQFEAYSARKGYY